MKKTKSLSLSSSKWLKRHKNDEYVILAKKHNYRSRAVFKLIDIEKKYKLIENSKYILDLGAYPGSWSQYILEKKKAACKVFAIDLKPMEEIEGLDFIQGDFCCEEVQTQLAAYEIDLICSDMAPNTSGNREVDHIKIMNLAKAVFQYSEKRLCFGGNMIIKVFEGGRTKDFHLEVRKKFEKVSFFKPSASYKDSSEIYIIAQGFKL